MSSRTPHAAITARRGHGDRQRQIILDFLESYIAENGWAPSMREIADAMGTGAPNVMQHLRVLRDQGKIVLGGGPRMIRLNTGRINVR